MFRNKLLSIFLIFVTLLVMVGPLYAQGTYQQAPMLDDAVASGDLPPIEERLPVNPLVLEPLEEIGTYGGTLRRGTAWLGPYLTENFTREPLFMWPLPLTTAGPPRPNLAESLEVNEDNTEFTVHLREGVKWSDGVPFTAADIAFLWNDVWLNENATRAIPGILLQDGEVPDLEVIDDFTIKFTYPAPFYFFTEGHASTLEIAWPKHYMSQFHPDYTDGADWETFNAMGELEAGRGKVTLQAWMLDEWVQGEMYKLVRNPYYWKVDPEGNQLPYFDYATVEMVEDRQSVAVGLITENFDLDAMWVGAQHIQLFTEAIQDGRDVSLTFATFQGMAIYFNMDVEDEVKREVYRDINFRRAFSLALNRAEIGDLFFSGLLTPGGSSFSPATGFRAEGDELLWAEYDPEAANAMLDEAGYADVDGDGWRETPNGDPLELVISVGQHDLYTPTVELITDTYLPDIGIKSVMDVNDQDLVYSKYQDNTFDIIVWDFEGSDDPLSGNFEDLAAAGPGTPYWHSNWQEVPVDDAFLQMNELMQQATSAPYEERVEMLTAASHLHADNVWIINTGWLARPFLKHNRLGNAPDEISRNSQVNDQPPWQAMLLFEKYLPGEAP